MRGDERRGAVEHFDACGGEPFELDRSSLDSVERLADVEPPKRDVSRLEDSKRVARGQYGCGGTQRLGGVGERLIRVRAPVCDDDEPHGADGAAEAADRGGRSGDASVATLVRLRACSRTPYRVWMKV